MIGDVPYGVEQEASVGLLVDAINEDPYVRLALHLGDIKSGSTDVHGRALRRRRSATFESFEDPVVYTPGDNEWTDCHRVNNGGYDPLERLAAVRGHILRRARVPCSVGRPSKRRRIKPELVENVRWIESRVAFATLHVIGSNNGLSPWTGIGNTVPTAEQAAEVDAPDRRRARLDRRDVRRRRASVDLRGVVLAMQADTWAPLPSSAQQAIVDRIALCTAAFDGEVLLLQGDSHTYVVDDPLALPNFTRIVVHGETLPFEYLRLTINPGRRDALRLGARPGHRLMRLLPRAAGIARGGPTLVVCSPTVTSPAGGCTRSISPLPSTEPRTPCGRSSPCRRRTRRSRRGRSRPAPATRARPTSPGCWRADVCCGRTSCARRGTTCTPTTHCG